MELRDVVRRYLDHYNEGDFIRASGYVSDKAVSECGGALNLAVAFQQLQDSERLRYELVDVKVNSVDGDKAFTYVTYNVSDVDDRQFLRTSTQAPTFIREHHIVEGRDVNWVYEQYSPPDSGLSALSFCLD